MKGSLCEEFVKWYLYNIEGSEIMGGGGAYLEELV